MDILDYLDISLLYHIDHSIKTKLKEEQETESLESIEIKEDVDSTLTLYHMKLTNKDVVMCTHIELDEGEDIIDVRGTCKFSICSENDTYKEEVGASIAVGRAVRKSKGHDFNVRFRKSTEVNIGEHIAAIVGDRVATLASVLMMRDRQLSRLKEKEHETYQSIKQDLEEFK